MISLDVVFFEFSFPYMDATFCFVGFNFFIFSAASFVLSFVGLFVFFCFSEFHIEIPACARVRCSYVYTSRSDSRCNSFRSARKLLMLFFNFTPPHGQNPFLPVFFASNISCAVVFPPCAFAPVQMKVTRKWPKIDFIRL